MRYIDLSKINPNSPEVIAWKKKAVVHLGNISTLSSHKDRKDYFSKNSFWSDFKPILLNIYGSKCWYSECSLDGSYGDVDHFRPKNKSTALNGTTILPDGYWWLAYDYNNYRLSCEKCNRCYNGGGKNDCFPLKQGSTPAINPQSSDDNILLDPCNQDDYYLIDSDENGDIIAMSTDKYDVSRVETSKKVYNWKEFKDGRKKARLESKTAIEMFEIFYQDNNANGIQKSLEQIKLKIDPKTPYSSFAVKYIYRKISGKPYEAIIKKLLESYT